MRHSTIEDKIIAYFDNQLTDNERAELLHRISVSPEIREVFEEHEQMRALALEARSNAVIRPAVERALFKQIEALAPAQKDFASLLFASQSSSLTSRYTAEVVFALFAVGIFLFGRAEHSVTSTISPNAVGRVATPVSAPILASASTEAEQLVISIKQVDVSSTTLKNASITSNADAVAPTLAIEQSTLATDAVAIEESNTLPIAMTAAPLRDGSSVSAASNTSVTSPLIGPIEANASEELGLEFGWTSGSSFSVPATASGGTPFRDHRVNVQWEFAEKFHLGAAVTWGYFSHLGDAQRSSSGTKYFATINRSFEDQREVAEEIYLQYRTPAPFGDRMLLDLSVGAGLLPGGNLVGAEVGLRYPLSTSFALRGGFSLSHIQSTSPKLEELARASGVGTPVILTGSDQRSSLQGKIQFGAAVGF